MALAIGRRARVVRVQEPPPGAGSRDASRDGSAPGSDSEAPPRLAAALDQSQRQSGSTCPLVGPFEDQSELDYRKPDRRFTSAVSPASLPARSRRYVRHLACGGDAFFSLFGWRFLRRSLAGIWRPMVAYTLLAALLIGLVEVASPEQRRRVERSLRSFALLFDFTRNFLVFTLTAVVGTMYSRWWEMRRLIGVVIGNTQDTTIMIATYIQGDDSEELLCELVRYLNLAHTLLHVQARSKHGRRELFTLEDLLSADLITQSEKQILQSMEGVSLNQVAYMWFLQLWLEAVRGGRLPPELVDSIHTKVQENVSTMRGAGGSIFMYQSTPPPIGYFRILYLLLNVSLFISPFGVYASLLKDSTTLMDRWMVVPVVFVIAFFMLSFVHMCHEMFDPFAEGLSHFPLRFYLGSTLRSCYLLLGAPREGRLRYYAGHPGEGALESEATPSPVRESESESVRWSRRLESASSVDSGASPGVIEYERLRHANLQRKSGRRCTHGVALGSAGHDRAEAEALRDMHEGNLFLGRPQWCSPQHQQRAQPSWARTPAPGCGGGGSDSPLHRAEASA